MHIPLEGNYQHQKHCVHLVLPRQHPWKLMIQTIKHSWYADCLWRHRPSIECYLWARGQGDHTITTNQCMLTVRLLVFNMFCLIHSQGSSVRHAPDYPKGEVYRYTLTIRLNSVGWISGCLPSLCTRSFDALFIGGYRQIWSKPAFVSGEGVLCYWRAVTRRKENQGLKMSVSREIMIYSTEDRAQNIEQICS